jgi:hypothetical protein
MSQASIIAFNSSIHSTSGTFSEPDGCVTRGKNYPPLQLSGGIDPDSRVRGTYTYRENLESSPFEMSEELPCVLGPPHDEPLKRQP